MVQLAKRRYADQAATPVGLSRCVQNRADPVAENMLVLSRLRWRWLQAGKVVVDLGLGYPLPLKFPNYHPLVHWVPPRWSLCKFGERLRSSS